MRLRATIVAESILLSMLLPSHCFGQTLPSGCRSLSEQIFYDNSPPPRGAHSVEIDAHENAARTLIVATGGPIPFRSYDYGKHWEDVKGDSAERVKLWSDVAQSDSSTLYQYESNGVIERSEDSGESWVKLSPKINGRTTAETAILISGKRDYVVEFEMTAVHPLKPETICNTHDPSAKKDERGFPQKVFPQRNVRLRGRW
jgi:hypothetical protein